MLLQIITATIIVSLISLVGIFTLILKQKDMKKITIFMIALAAGTLMADAFIHLIPDAINKGASMTWVLIGFIIFLLFEKLIHWHHYDKNHTIHSLAYVNTMGDLIHNFIDGVIIGATFLADMRLGIITTIAIIFHEIPQEIGDFGVLIHSGLKIKTAILINLLTALTAILGGVVAYLLSTIAENSIKILTPLAAGGFIYIAASDLIPELMKEKNLKKSLIHLIIFIIGAALITGVGLFE